MSLACSKNTVEDSRLNEWFLKSAEHLVEELPGLPENNGDAESGSAASNAQTVTEGPAPTNTATPTPTSTPTPTPTSTPTPTPTPTNTPTPTPVVETYAKDGNFAAAPAFSGKAYIITDADSGEVVLARNASVQLYPASTIKLLTAMTALEHADLSDLITSDSHVLAAIAEDASQYGAVGGMTFPLEVWMNLLLIVSAADAADTIAAGTAGSVAKFVDWMNEEALRLGMLHTHVDNTIGLDIGNGFTQMYSTADDIAKLAAAAMKNPAIAAIVAKEEYQVPDCEVMKGRLVKSTNYYYTKRDQFHSSYFTAIGTKSGMTDAAGSCFVATVVNPEGRTYICSCFGAEYKSVLFTEMTELLNYVYQNYQ